MLFNSFEFLCIFFPLVTGLYFTVPHHRRWMVLLAASCWFYMAFVPVYILILGFTIGVDYFAGIWIERNEGRKRKLLLAASIVANVSVLAFFKYFNFLNESIAAAVRTMGFHYGVPDLGIILPIGLSFHTFQSLSYTIEVYRKHQKAEHRFGIFALYVMFYPQLVAGPIERPGNLLNQINSSTVGVGMRSDFDHDRVLKAIRQDGSLHGMGTTVVGMVLEGGIMAVAHVGDSRAYRLRDGRFELLTQDHTWVNEQVVAGFLTEEQARVHPLKNVVTRALGGDSEVEVDVREWPVQVGDLFLLCSDGLTTMLSDPEILERLRSSSRMEELCGRLVRDANARGGFDNISVVLLRIESDADVDSDEETAAGVD